MREPKPSSPPYARPERPAWPAGMAYGLAAAAGFAAVFGRQSVSVLTDPLLRQFALASVAGAALSMAVGLVGLTMGVTSILKFSARKLGREVRGQAWMGGLLSGAVGVPGMLVGIGWSINGKSNFGFLLGMLCMLASLPLAVMLCLRRPLAERDTQ